MIKSMTGFGKAEFSTNERKTTIEIKSLNSKQLDLGIRLPSIYKEKESQIRSMISESLKRGKVDFCITTESIEGRSTSENISEALFTSYYNEIKSLSEKVGAKNIQDSELISSILRIPGVIEDVKSEIQEEEWELLIKCVSTALTEINSFRETEGKRLISDILLHVDKIEEYLGQIPQFESERIDTIKTRMREKLKLSEVTVDENRFEQEIIYYLEKLDITEEKVRLGQHINYFRETAESDEDTGRKLGFIAQEMGREINTTGSKANHTEIQKLVVQMKDELEKIKEQICNLL